MLLPGRAVVVWGRGGAVDGVIGKRPTHLIPEAERGKAPDVADQWIDIGARDRAAALDRVACGDAVTFAPHFLELGGGVVAGRALDDRAGVYVVARALELYAADPAPPRSRRSRRSRKRPGTWAPTCRRAASGPTASSSSTPSSLPTSPRSIPARRRRGRARRRSHRRSGRRRQPGAVTAAREVAAAEAVAVQLKAFPGDTQTDNEWLQTAGGGTAALNLGIPVRYMHSPHEVAHLDDLEAAARLIAALARHLGESFAAGWFTPRP